MTRGNQREKAREKNLKKLADKSKGAAHTAPKTGGVNADADKLQAKVEAKRAKEAADAAAGIKGEEKDYGTNYKKTEKVVNPINPHTGKRDPALAAKSTKK
jgi:hypothetical protein